MDCSRCVITVWHTHIIVASSVKIWELVAIGSFAFLCLLSRRISLRLVDWFTIESGSWILLLLRCDLCSETPPNPEVVDLWVSSPPAYFSLIGDSRLAEL